VGVLHTGFDPRRSTYDYWLEKGGGEYADAKDAEYRKTMSEAILSADMSKQKLAARKTFSDMNRTNIGKTNIELYGHEKAERIRQKKSIAASGDKNPAYGKVYARGGRSVKGWYKTFFFRSLLEYSFMKYQESLGREIGKDFHPYEVLIPYIGSEGQKRTYRPDFLVLDENCVYEIKQSYALEFPVNVEKFKAGKVFCDMNEKNFRVATELDFPKISFDEARLDKDIVWDERTFEYFKNDN